MGSEAVLHADAASSQASAWAAFAPHRVQHVAVPAKRTLDFDAADEPEPEHQSEPEPKLKTQPGPEPIASSQAVTEREVETTAGSQTQHAQQPSPQDHLGQQIWNSEVNDQPEAGAESELGAPSCNDMAAQVDKDGGAPVTPAQTGARVGAGSDDYSPVLATAEATPEVPHTTTEPCNAAECPQTSHTETKPKLMYSDQSRVPTVHMGTASIAVAGSEPETPSARDIAHKGPALAFAPEWSHSTAASSTVKMADTAGSSHKAQEPLPAVTISGKTCTFDDVLSQNHMPACCLACKSVACLHHHASCLHHHVSCLHHHVLQPCQSHDNSRQVHAVQHFSS